MADFITAVVHFDAVDAPGGFNKRRGRHVCGARPYDEVHSGLRSRTSRMFDTLREIPIDSRCYGHI